MNSKKAEIDLTQLRTITEGDQQLEQKLFHMFFETSRRCLAMLEVAISAGDGDAWPEVAHELKGAAASVGAVGMAKLCENVEHLPCLDVPHRREQLTELQKEYHRVHAYLSRLY